MAYPNDLTKHYQALASPEETLHKQVEDIVSSYNSHWDPLTELIQNSVDAINQRKQKDLNFTKGKIVINVDAKSNCLTVEDNGMGIPPGKCQDMILPGGTLKGGQNTYGHKGLGFTYCAHVAQFVEIDTEYHVGNQKEHCRLCQCKVRHLPS